MAKILLDYVFPISVVSSIPAASTAFLKQVALVCKPKTGQEANVGELYECTTMAAVAARTDNTEAQQLFDAGMTKVMILLADDLDLAAYMTTHANKFFSLLICSQFDEDDVETTQASLTINGDLTFTAVEGGSGGNAITVALVNDNGVTAGDETVEVTGNDIVITIDGGVSTATQIKAAFDAAEEAVALATCTIVEGQGSAAQAAAAEAPLANGDGLYLGTYDGITGISSDDLEFLEDQAVISKRSAFFTKSANGAKNMLYAFGKLLSNLVNWRNQQYIEMPFGDDVDVLGEATSLFDDKISFVIEDDEFGKRLALFAAGGKAIVAPYILKNLRIDLQSAALSWIALNSPQYTIKEATLLEQRLQEDVINSYITRGWIESGTISIALEQENFVASGEILVPTPKALWRVVSEMTEA
jgi:hypothetical protein